jgi:hypothetical protein
MQQFAQACFASKPQADKAFFQRPVFLVRIDADPENRAF